MTQIPIEHARDAQKLTADGIAELFEIQLTQGQGTVRIWNGEQLTWQGNLYESLGCAVTGDERSADEKQGRPTFTVFNPNNVLSPFVVGGFIENAVVIRKRVLRTHIDLDVNIFQRRVWVISRISNIRDQVIQLELREPYEGPNSLIPARVYIPPEFPAVNLR